MEHLKWLWETKKKKKQISKYWWSPGRIDYSRVYNNSLWDPYRY